MAKKTKPKPRSRPKTKPRRKPAAIKFDLAEFQTMLEPIMDEIAKLNADTSTLGANDKALQTALARESERLAKVDVLCQSQQAMLASLMTRSVTYSVVEALEKRIDDLSAAELRPSSAPADPRTLITNALFVGEPAAPESPPPADLEFDLT